MSHLLLRYKRTPKHTNALAHHADLQFVIVLEPRNKLLKRGVTLELEAVPECPRGVAVFILLSRNRLGEAEEWEREVYESVLVAL